MSQISLNVVMSYERYRTQIHTNRIALLIIYKLLKGEVPLIVI